MAEAIVGMISTTIRPQIYNSTLQKSKLDINHSCPRSLKQCSRSGLFGFGQQIEGGRNGRNRGCLIRANAFWDWPLMAVLVENLEGQMDMVIHKSIWHLSDIEIKNVYIAYIMFTCWGCLVFGSMKDPYYDSDSYRKDGGDGTGHWIYEKQEDIEETSRSELWKEELIDEIEQKVGGLRELEETSTK